MHSFHPSRGRIFFEVLCAAGIAASCGGAWLQTGASALLAAASIATLYCLVHFFDLFRRNPTVQVEPQRIEFEPPLPAESPPVRQEIKASLAAIEPRLVVDNMVEDAQPAEQVPLVEEIAPPAKSPRRAKTPRKAAGRAKASKSAKGVELLPAAESHIEMPARADAVEPQPQEETFHPPAAPLFEPEPFVRQQQRAMFGRKAG